jgi:tetratricopeptide (TPR) repeat protein
MSALPRPDLPPGPHRDLVTELHDLHHRAGWPSLRTLAREAGVSHTTVSKAFSSTSLPSWGTVELLVEAMGGTAEDVHELWLAASTPTNGDAPPTPRIAGRRAELAAVRRHLEAGTGLLLLTGEAGIGKTTLVKAAAAEATTTFVALGHCHQLSAEIPLMPVAEALREIHEHDDGRWFADALAGCPPYVRGALARLLPELDDASPQHPEDEFARQRLFMAMSTALARLGELRPLALVFEDLHWADQATLDLLDHLLDRSPVPLASTVRTDDPGVATAVAERVALLRARSAPDPVVLTPLDRAGTAEQLALALGSVPDEALLDAIHTRAQGLPLFTEQLASAGGDSFPDRLADLLDARLGMLDGPDWSIMRALGVADRPLPSAVLQAATMMAADDLVAGLRELSQRRLVSAEGGGDAARLRHPLLAEAVRRRLVPGEAWTQHRHLAEALEQFPDAEPGELAHHWQAAGDDEHEVRWRLTAAERADARFADREAYEHWSRALEIWPSPGVTIHGQSLPHVLSRAIDTARRHGLIDRARELTTRVRSVGAEGADLAELVTQTGDLLCIAGDRSEGLLLLDEALDLYDTLPPSPGLVRCLDARASTFVHLGSYASARADVDRALNVAVEIGDTREERRILGWAAWLELAEGDTLRARELSQKARTGLGGSDDPFVEVMLAVNATDILLHLGAPVAEVDATAEHGLGLADRWGLELRLVGMLRGNVAWAHLREGDVRGAMAVLLEFTGGTPTFASYDAHGVRVEVEGACGLLEDATARAAALDALDHNHNAAWAETQASIASMELWAGTTSDALARLEAAVGFLLGTDNSRLAAGAAALTARAAADCADRAAAVRLRALVAGAADDPFGPRAIGVATPAWSQVWRAELDRLEGGDPAEGWVRAAALWDDLRRPHDASYCRWRAAQCARRDGHGTVAAKLLKKAAADAREHVPLAQAIAATR